MWNLVEILLQILAGFLAITFFVKVSLSQRSQLLFIFLELLEWLDSEHWHSSCFFAGQECSLDCWNCLWWEFHLLQGVVQCFFAGFHLDGPAFAERNFHGFFATIKCYYFLSADTVVNKILI